MGLIELATAVSGLVGIIETGIAIAEKVAAKQKPGDSDVERAEEFLKIAKDKELLLAQLKEVFDFLFLLLPESAKLYAFSDKIRETLVANKSFLAGEDGKEKDQHWATAVTHLNSIGNMKQSVDNLTQGNVPMVDCSEIARLLEKCISFDRAFTQALTSAGGGRTEHDLVRLEDSCTLMACAARDMQALIRKHIKDMLDAVVPGTQVA